MRPWVWSEINLLHDVVHQLGLLAKRHDLYLVTLVFLVVAAALAIASRRLRPHVRTALTLFGLGLFLLLLSAVAAALGWATAAYALYTAGLLLAVCGEVKLGSLILFDLLLGPTPLSPPQVLRDLLVAAGYVGVALWVLSRSGVSIASIVATSAVVTGVVVFSLQDSLSNIFGGLVLQIDEAFVVGDWVKLGETSGRVKEITWRHVAIETRNWDTVIVPNSLIIKSQLVVTGQRAGEPVQQRRWIYFNVDFRVPPTEVIRVVTEALVTAPVEGCAAHPAPNVVLMEFKESYCQYAARYWLTDLPNDDPTDSLVRQRIYCALERADIPLSVPALTTFVETRDQERQKLHHEREIAQRLTALDLAKVELFREMNDNERRLLVERLRYAPFLKGELITRQGIEAHWLYLLTKGSAEVFVSTEEGVRKTVRILHAGDFFGEMSLLTGEPRTSSLKALEDCDCYRLDRNAFEDILHSRPEIAQYLSELLARRKVEIEAVRQDLDAEARAEMMKGQQESIFDKIHKLFGLSSDKP
jgi:small-conductance mechanosensitive channel